MCIIISKPAGIPLPSIETLKTCWERNPHGAGYATAYNGNVFIRKGFMDWEDFANGIDFNRLEPYACVFHFRFATHGSTCPGNCHPFPVSGNLKKTYRKTDVAIAHNGVINQIKIDKKDYSDTMSYIEKRIAPYWRLCKEHGALMYSNKSSKKTLLEETDSKWSFLFANGKIINVGDGVEEDGIWYSNAGFRCYSYFQANSPRQAYPNGVELVRPLAMAGYF
jgi:predicted glutamine amidotransferase